MEKVKIILLMLFLGLSLTALAMFFRGGRVEYNPPEIAETMPRNVDMKLTGINFTEVTHDGREWTMKADTLHYIRSKELMILDNVQATIYGPDGEMRVSGEKGFYHKANGQVRLVGRVRALDAKGRRLTTEEVIFHIPTKVLRAPGPFKIRGPQLDLDGSGLAVFTKRSVFKVVDRANMILRPARKLL